MVIIVKKEELVALLKENLQAWASISGGPNMQAFEFDPNLADTEMLDSLGYYSNRDSWIAGVQIKKIKSYIESNLIDTVPGAQNSD